MSDLKDFVRNAIESVKDALVESGVDGGVKVDFLLDQPAGIDSPAVKISFSFVIGEKAETGHQ